MAGKQKPKGSRYTGVFPSGRDRWGYVIDLPPVDGKRRQERRAGFLSEDEALDARRRREAELGRGTLVAARDITVARAIDDRLAALRLAGRKPTTLLAYRGIADRHIIPVLGDRRLADLTPADVRAWLTRLRREGRSAQTAASALTLLRAVLRQQVSDGTLERNVALSVRVPAPPRTRPTVLSGEEIARLLGVADHDRDAALWRLGLLCQLRPGELIALRWDDLDLERGTLTIRRTLTMDEHGRRVLGTSAKTPGSHATIALPVSCIDALRQQRARVAERRLRFPGVWADLGLVFPARGGTALHPDTLSQRLLRLCQAAGVPEITPHELRHSGATWLLAEGADLKTISERLRHASTHITADLYLHPGEEAQRRAGATLDAALERLRERGA